MPWSHIFALELARYGRPLDLLGPASPFRRSNWQARFRPLAYGSPARLLRLAKSPRVDSIRTRSIECDGVDIFCKLRPGRRHICLFSSHFFKKPPRQMERESTWLSRIDRRVTVRLASRHCGPRLASEAPCRDGSAQRKSRTPRLIPPTDNPPIWLKLATRGHPRVEAATLARGAH